MTVTDNVEETCGAIYTFNNGLGGMAVCLRPEGHDDEHIGMLGQGGVTMVHHWGTIDRMTRHMVDLIAKGVR